MKKIALYCKSFNRDVYRALKLAESNDRFNKGNIPLYISTPSSDKDMFEKVLGHTRAMVLSDEEIITANSSHYVEEFNALPGSISQQIIKSEFWRLGISENYLCVDSDAEFIREFDEGEFLASDGTPYTVINEAKELLEFSVRQGNRKIKSDFFAESKMVQEIFGRNGKHYSFGIPAVWSSKVWRAVEMELLVPNRISLKALIEKVPHEARIYGEALLKYTPIKILPSEPMFKTYFYESQYWMDEREGNSVECLKENYVGILKQSNWSGEHHGIQKGLASRLARHAKRSVKKFIMNLKNV